MLTLPARPEFWQRFHRNSVKATNALRSRILGQGCKDQSCLAPQTQLFNSKSGEVPPSKTQCCLTLFAGRTPCWVCVVHCPSRLERSELQSCYEIVKLFNIMGWPARDRYVMCVQRKRNLSARPDPCELPRCDHVWSSYPRKVIFHSRVSFVRTIASQLQSKRIQKISHSLKKLEDVIVRKPTPAKRKSSKPHHAKNI